MWYLLKKIVSWGEDNPSSLPLRKSSCDLQYVCCHTSHAGGLYVPRAFSITAFWHAVSFGACALLRLPSDSCPDSTEAKKVLNVL